MSLGDDDSGGMMPMFSFSTNGLWLEITGVTNGLAYLNLHNATNQVYEVLTKTDLLLTNWTIENEVWPTNSGVMPFNISELGRTNLFVWAMDWTGVTENGNTTPNWWFWDYFQGQPGCQTRIWIFGELPCQTISRTELTQTSSILASWSPTSISGPARPPRI